jgi:Cu/Ag efflux pump CusA
MADRDVDRRASEIQAPMAMVILFGLVSSTALNMIVFSVLYDRFGRK